MTVKAVSDPSKRKDYQLTLCKYPKPMLFKGECLKTINAFDDKLTELAKKNGFKTNSSKDYRRRKCEFNKGKRCSDKSVNALKKSAKKAGFAPHYSEQNDFQLTSFKYPRPTLIRGKDLRSINALGSKLKDLAQKNGFKSNSSKRNNLKLKGCEVKKSKRSYNNESSQPQQNKTFSYDCLYMYICMYIYLKIYFT